MSSQELKLKVYFEVIFVPRKHLKARYKTLNFLYNSLTIRLICTNFQRFKPSIHKHPNKNINPDYNQMHFGDKTTVFLRRKGSNQLDIPAMKESSETEISSVPTTQYIVLNETHVKSSFDCQLRVIELFRWPVSANRFQLEMSVFPSRGSGFRGRISISLCDAFLL